MILLFILLLLSYLAGSVPTSIIMGRITQGIDIRDFGSGNAGGTNAFRVLGWKPALVVVLVDIFKGWFAAAMISGLTFGRVLGDIPFNDPHISPILCGGAAVLGHTFTLFAGFRGGKGVGTLGGMILHLFPLALLLGLAVWVLVLIATGYVSVGSVTAVALFPLVTYLRDGTLNSSLGYFSLFILAFIWFTHRSNMARMLAGNENRFEKAMVWRKKKSSLYGD
ncbi:MAG: glycerol-3-phosphate 1-O-acyltransferase PlsY [Fidelibacterota bacterium]|nr:MAG: glycerol-3-phosphate 1-O-acyltransferase PlsY [Candidatus Neomarinimicrobiota bacterium]